MDRRERKALLAQLRRDAALIAQRFGLNVREILAEDQRVTSRYGVCYQDGLIKIRLNHAKTGRPLKYSSLIDTLCHELAHLRHFNHGPEFRAFFWRLLAWARRQGIYCPGAPAPGGELAAPLPVPRLPSPPRRNGVPVFPRAEAVSYELPWESKQSAPTVDGPSAPVPPRPAPVPPRPAPVPPRPAPVPPRPAHARRPEQLPLF